MEDLILMEEIGISRLKFYQEKQYYSTIKKTFEALGYFTQRIEGVPGMPDFWMCSKHWAFWAEVKLYKGDKSLEYISIKDLVFQKGQFLKRKLIQQKDLQAWRLIVVKPNTPYMCVFY